MRSEPRLFAIGDHVLWRGRFGHVIGFYEGSHPYDGDVIVSLTRDLNSLSGVEVLPQDELKPIDGKRYL